MIYPQILLYLRYFFKTPAGASRPHIMWLHTKSMKTANPNLSWSTVEAMSVEKMVKLKDVRKLTTLGETHHIFFLRHFCRTFLGKYRGNLAQKSPRFPWICMGKNYQVVHFMKSLVAVIGFSPSWTWTTFLGEIFKFRPQISSVWMNNTFGSRRRWFVWMGKPSKVQLAPKWNSQQNPRHAVDGSEIRLTTWNIQNPSSIRGFQLPVPQLVSRISEPSTASRIPRKQIRVLNFLGNLLAAGSQKWFGVGRF